VTRDAGRSWSEVTAAPLTASSQIQALAVSPDFQNDRIVLVSTRDRGLLRSADRGMSFRAVGTELLDANHLVADFANPTSAPIQFSPPSQPTGPCSRTPRRPSCDPPTEGIPGRSSPLWVLGVGGGRTGRALALHVGGAVLVLAAALVGLAA
jgi:hypothetical protein